MFLLKTTHFKIKETYIWIVIKNVTKISMCFNVIPIGMIKKVTYGWVPVAPKWPLTVGFLATKRMKICIPLLSLVSTMKNLYELHKTMSTSSSFQFILNLSRSSPRKHLYLHNLSIHQKMKERKEIYWFFFSLLAKQFIAKFT